MMKNLTVSLNQMQESNLQSAERQGRRLNEAICGMQESNEKKLEEMRRTVDEKLSETLNARLNASFKTVSEQLSNVYQSLGEMKELSGGVTDSVRGLNRVLTNVKVRGVWAEAQLEEILNETIPGMYDKNVATNPKSIERVEFAVRIPSGGDDGGFVYLPVDSKFPMEDYARLTAASESGDIIAVEEARKALIARIRDEAKAVSKYINPVSYTHLDVYKRQAVNGPIEGISKDEKLLLVCKRGKRAYFLQNRLKYYGYENTVVLEGATTVNDVRVKNSSAAVPAEEVTRVKALGFLWDKNSADRFNGRVITRNGKITAEESAVIAEAARRYGSGEITMTSRLTLEIQGVPFDNIEPLREFLAQAGLETGGTGSKVRPVVSCKGTTCQYGLIDTFALSEEIHERFFKGYSGVKLPHKFKIAVGGCPNNCVKPDLNDLGIIGQRVPEVNLDKCRGCKVCQIEKACPVNAASVADGKVVIDESVCNHCGRCLRKCPFKAFEEYTGGYRIYIGGRWGKKVARGRCLEKVFTDREEVLNIVEKAILLFREQGMTGERFADTVARLGFENVQKQLLADDLLQRKAENIAAQKHLKGGATC